MNDDQTLRFRLLIRRWLVRGRQREWAPTRTRLWDSVAVSLLTIVGALLRTTNLGSVPAGIQGDEATTALLARQVLRHQSIGIYTGLAGGNPTGEFYLAAPFVKWIDDPVVAVRMSSAVGGTVAIVLLFVLVRRNFGFVSAVVATALFTVSEWAIQFSRVGFVTGDWIPLALLGAICLLEARRSEHWLWWAAAGLTVPLPIYIYNGHAPVLLIIMPIVVMALVIGRVRDRRLLVNVLSFLVGFAVVLRPMVNFMTSRPNDYFGRARELSVFSTATWKSTDGVVDSIRFLVERYLQFWNRLTFNPRPDGVDLSGVTAPIPRLMFAALLIGLILCWIFRPGWPALLSTALILLAPLSAVLTDLTTRRALVILPFACAVGGAGLSALLLRAWRSSNRLGYVTLILLVVGMIRIVQVNLTDFFGTTMRSGAVFQTFNVTIRDTAEYIGTLPEDDIVHLFSFQYAWDYETRVLFAPNIQGENRARTWGGDERLSIDRADKTNVFVLDGTYRQLIDPLKRLYPSGTTVTGPIRRSDSGPSFVSFVIPATLTN